MLVEQPETAQATDQYYPEVLAAVLGGIFWVSLSPIPIVVGGLDEGFEQS